MVGEMIEFSEWEAALLWTIPHPPVRLSEIISAYTFLNRDAPPPPETLEACLEKALHAGIVAVLPNRTLRIGEDWYERIHGPDEELANEAEAMIQFWEWLTAQAWPRKNRQPFSLRDISD